MRLVFFLLAFGFAAAPGLRAERFFYKHIPGDKYRILSTVNEDVYIDRILSSRAEILNRVAVTVGEARAGISRHEAVFQTAERSVGVNGWRSFEWAREYTSVFGRDRLGHITIGGEYYMPVVRNVPVFPDRDIQAGETWTAEGYEAHDFRDSFGIQAPYRIPFTANYTFLGPRKWRETSYPAIGVSYRIVTEPAAVSGSLWPTRIAGTFNQTIYWDMDMGREVAYEETFQIAFTLSNGITIEFRGQAEAELIESEAMNKETLAEEISEDIRRLGIEDVSVRVVEEGIAISLEDIQFQADSAELLPMEQLKLDKIGEILRRYADRDILVGGHTALAGTQEGRRRLSVERAGAVADYLITKGVRGSERIVVRGYGAERPLGNNNTEEGRRRNRRVEITVLEN